MAAPEPGCRLAGRLHSGGREQRHDRSHRGMGSPPGLPGGPALGRDPGR
jgi:hypothetical protein